MEKTEVKKAKTKKPEIKKVHKPKDEAQIHNLKAKPKVTIEKYWTWTTPDGLVVKKYYTSRKPGLGLYMYQVIRDPSGKVTATDWFHMNPKIFRETNKDKGGDEDVQKTNG